VYPCDVVDSSEKPSKMPRIVHYDSKEVRKYMKTRREQQRQKRRDEIEATANAKATKERKLQELMQRQHEAAAASAASTRRKMASLQQVNCVWQVIFTFIDVLQFCYCLFAQVCSPLPRKYLVKCRQRVLCTDFFTICSCVYC